MKMGGTPVNDSIVTEQTVKGLTTPKSPGLLEVIDRINSMPECVPKGIVDTVARLSFAYGSQQMLTDMIEVNNDAIMEVANSTATIRLGLLKYLDESLEKLKGSDSNGNGCQKGQDEVS